MIAPEETSNPAPVTPIKPKKRLYIIGKQQASTQQSAPPLTPPDLRNQQPDSPVKSNNDEQPNSVDLDETEESSSDSDSDYKDDEERGDLNADEGEGLAEFQAAFDDLENHEPDAEGVDEGGENEEAAGEETKETETKEAGPVVNVTLDFDAVQEMAKLSMAVPRKTAEQTALDNKMTVADALKELGRIYHGMEETVLRCRKVLITRYPNRQAFENHEEFIKIGLLKGFSELEQTQYAASELIKEIPKHKRTAEMTETFSVKRKNIAAKLFRHYIKLGNELYGAEDEGIDPEAAAQAAKKKEEKANAQAKKEEKENAQAKKDDTKAIVSNPPTPATDKKRKGKPTSDEAAAPKNAATDDAKQNDADNIRSPQFPLKRRDKGSADVVPGDDSADMDVAPEAKEVTDRQTRSKSKAQQTAAEQKAAEEKVVEEKAAEKHEKFDVTGYAASHLSIVAQLHTDISKEWNVLNSSCIDYAEKEKKDEDSFWEGYYFGVADVLQRLGIPLGLHVPPTADETGADQEAKPYQGTTLLHFKEMLEDEVKNGVTSREAKSVWDGELTLFPYPGNKDHVAKDICCLFPKSKDNIVFYVEPCVGAGGMLFEFLKRRSAYPWLQKVSAYDKDPIVIRYFEYLQSNPRQLWTELCTIYEMHNNSVEPAVFFDKQVQKLGTMPRDSADAVPLWIYSMNNPDELTMPSWTKMEHMSRLIQGVVFQVADIMTVLDKWDLPPINDNYSVLLYIDPPYYDSSNEATAVGYQALAERLYRLRHPWAMSNTASFEQLLTQAIRTHQNDIFDFHVHEVGKASVDDSDKKEVVFVSYDF